jgi:hypothetical protein
MIKLKQIGSLTSCPGQNTAALFTAGNRAQHIFNGNIHMPSFRKINDTILVSFVKQKKLPKNNIGDMA